MLIDDLDKLEQNLLLKRELIKHNREKLNILNNNISELSKISDNINKDILNTEKAIKFLKTLKLNKRNQDSSAITNALDSIIEQLFPNERLRFNISSKLKGNYTYSKLEYFKGTSTKPKLIKYRSGNGLRQVVSFTAVYTLLALSNNTPTIILDECFRSISTNESELMSEVLNNLSELGFQLIIIEHNENVFKKLKNFEVYTLEKVFENSREYTRIKNHSIKTSD